MKYNKDADNQVPPLQPVLNLKNPCQEKEAPIFLLLIIIFK